MANNHSHRSVFYDLELAKDKWLTLFILLGLNIFFFKEEIFTWAVIFYLMFSVLMYKDIGNRVGKYFEVQRKEIPTVLWFAGMMTFFFVYMFRYYSYDSSNLQIYTMGLGATFLVVGLFFLKYKDKIKLKKRVNDYPNLKQEQMYDELPTLGLFNQFRLKKLPKMKTIEKKYFFGLKTKKITFQDGFYEVVDYADVDLAVSHDKYKTLLPEVEKEIKDIINQENRDFYKYHLTFLENEREALDMVERLSLDVSKIKPAGFIDKLFGNKDLIYKSKDNKGEKKEVYKRIIDGSFMEIEGKQMYVDGYNFARFWYQMTMKNIKSISSSKRDISYDFKKSLDKFSGVFEYAMIDLYMFQSNYFNRPIGNSKSLALIDYMKTGNYNALELCGAMDSSIFTSVKRRGVAYLTGYLVTLKLNNWLNPVEEQKIKEMN